MTVTNAQIVPLPYSYLTGCGLNFNTTTSLSLEIGQARDNTNSFDIPITSPIVINATSNGVNGLDVGSLQASRFYYVFIINSSLSLKTPAALLSLSPTTPFLPVGYDLLRLIGVWNTNSGSTFFNLQQSGMGGDKIYFYESNIQQVLLNGNATTFSLVNLSLFVPPIVNVIAALNTTYSPASVGALCFLRPTGVTSNGSFSDRGIVSGVFQSSFFEILALINPGIPSIDYKVDNSGSLLNIYVSGFIISL